MKIDSTWSGRIEEMRGDGCPCSQNEFVTSVFAPTQIVPVESELLRA